MRAERELGSPASPDAKWYRRPAFRRDRCGRISGSRACVSVDARYRSLLFANFGGVAATSEVCAISPSILFAVSTRVLVESCAWWHSHREDAFMRGDSPLGKADPKTVPPIMLSRWINEPYPPITELLSAHDVARLTRRPRWLLGGLELIGRFPRKARFRGRALGWWRSDVLEWMARDLALDRRQTTSSQPSLRRQPRQPCLPLESRERCAAIRMDSRGHAAGMKLP